MATKAFIHGTISIGDPTKTPPPIDIPIDAKLPPEKSGTFVFDYQAKDIETAAKINIASFLTWLNSTFSINIPVDSLPTSLQAFTIAVLKFHLDTDGNYDIQIEMGSTDQGKWVPEWKPIPSIGITLKELGIEVTNMDQLSWVQDWINDHAGPNLNVKVSPSPRRLAGVS